MHLLRLKNDKDVFIAAFLNRYDAVDADSELMNEIPDEMMIESIRKNPYALSHAKPHLQNDKELVLATVKKEGWALEFASKRLQNDKDVVLAAVSQLGGAIQFASKKLQQDREILLAAVKESGLELGYREINRQLKEMEEQWLDLMLQYFDEHMSVPEAIRMNFNIENG